MRRNFGSLNLAALDLHDAACAVDGLERQFSALDPCASECDSLDSLDSAVGDEALARCVGLPLERLAIAPDSSAAAAVTAPVAISPRLAAADSADVSGRALPSRRKRSISARGLDDDGDVRISNKLVATSAWPPRMHEQHHVELGALRCLSLKVMLSSLSTATSSSSDDSESPLSSSGGSYREKAAAVMPMRRPSIPCNMIQSV